MEALEDEELSADSYYELSKIAMIKNDKDKAIQFANIAIDIDASKVVPKIKKDPIFIPVIARISIILQNKQSLIKNPPKNIVLFLANFGNILCKI